MHYKTIILELLKQNPQRYQELCASRTLLPTLNRYASTLKDRHEYWTNQLGQERLEQAPSQLTSSALEFALQELQDMLPAESPQNPSAAEPLSLDAAMAFLRRHTPPV